MRSFFLGNGSSGQQYDRGMSLRALCLIGLLGAIPAALAQNKQSVDPPIQATTCQLETHPSAYDHKLVEVRGRVYFGKFDFVIDSSCKPHSQGRVWLDLGGDVQAPGVGATKYAKNVSPTSVRTAQSVSLTCSMRLIKRNQRSDPIAVHAKICTCNSCGYEWDDEDNL
jgi:hypothetical protein